MSAFFQQDHWFQAFAFALRQGWPQFPRHQVPPINLVAVTILFIILHLAWLALMTLGAMFVEHGHPFSNKDYLVALTGVISGCVSVCLRRRRPFAALAAIPYLAGIVYMVNYGLVELRWMQANRMDPAPVSTFMIFGLAFLSLALWIVIICLPSRKSRAG